MDGLDRTATSFFGEGTFDEGIVYECFNYASVNKLPVLFVCENNFYATESPIEVRQPSGTQLIERARAFKIDAQKVDGNDVIAVYEATRNAVERMRKGGGPFFLECETYRWLEHVGPMYDHELKRLIVRSRKSARSSAAWWRAGRRLLDRGLPPGPA
jgi:pyruvate dehydrogenase E1 component alpha subunit